MLTVRFIIIAACAALPVLIGRSAIAPSPGSPSLPGLNSTSAFVPAPASWSSRPGAPASIVVDSPTRELHVDGVTPIHWALTRETLPILIAPAATVTMIDVNGTPLALVDAAGPIARARIDGARYAGAPIEMRDGLLPLWIVAVATLTLALATLSPKRAATVVAAVAITWSIGLIVALAARPAIARIAAGDAVWLVARRPGTASVAIVDGAAWVPIVESSRQWNTLAPQIVVDPTGRATLELTLASPGARVALERPARR